MPRLPANEPPDSARPAPARSVKRWTNGEPIIEWDDSAQLEWCEKWAPSCPDGNPQRLRRALGFRERNVAELELRVALSKGELGVCEVIVDELDAEVYVRVFVCYDEDDEVEPGPREYTDCPVRVWLDCPLGERAVIDVDSDEELPIFTPRYLNNVLQPDHGYRAANRRRRPQADSAQSPSAAQANASARVIGARPNRVASAKSSSRPK